MRSLLLFLFSHRSLASMRWDLHFIGVRFAGWLGGQRRRAVRCVAGRARPVLLNLGSGPRGLDDGHWVNVDGYRAANVHFVIDLLRPLPFADASFDGAFSEHVLEHFTWDDGLRITTEVARTLRAGGVLRVVVPDGAFVLRSYFDDPDALVRHRGTGAPGETAMQMVNSFFRQRYEHQFMYDWPTLRDLLERAGFDEVTHSAFGQSACLALQIDDAKYQRESLYVDARKAGGPPAQSQGAARRSALEAAADG